MAIRSLSRRTFLKVAGLTAGALLLAPGSAQGAGNYFIAQAEAFGRQYRGTRDGLVFESVDGGQNWQQVANFGAHCVVQALNNRQDQLQARVGVAGYDFTLATSDGRKWYTA